MERRKRESREGCYVDRDGTRSDAAFHAEMLEDDPASDNADIVAARRAVASGRMTEDEAIRFFFTSSQRKRIFRED